MRLHSFAARCLSIAALTGIGFFSAACTTNNGAGARCTEYLACLSTASPGELPAALQLYGQDGSCTAALGSTQCELSCEQALGQLKLRPGLDGCTSRLSADLGDSDAMMSFDRTALELWDFGIKGSYYAGTFRDPELTGIDPRTGKWRCMRDDTNPDPPVEIARFGEPNDLPDQAITLSVPQDPDPSYKGSSHEICPDRTSPLQPDLDVFRFSTTTPGNVRVDVEYTLETGDLDVALFRAPAVAGEKPVRITSDLSARDNACVSASPLPAGKYYVVVRGSRILSMSEAYTMGRYRIRVAKYSDGAFRPCS